MHGIYSSMYIYLECRTNSHPMSIRLSTLPCVCDTPPKHSTTRPCDLCRHTDCAMRSPVNHWPAPVMQRVVVAPTGTVYTMETCTSFSYQAVWQLYLKDFRTFQSYTGRITINVCKPIFIQCFDSVNWVTGRASSM